MNITYESITVGFLLSVPVIVALYHLIAVTIAYAINDVLNDYRDPITFSRPKKKVMLIQVKPSFIFKSYTVTPIPEREMVYKSYTAESIA
jgi:hypothetical protein